MDGLSGTDTITTLRPEQFADPQRGPFRVGVSFCKQPRFHRGHRVHVDATGERFIVVPREGGESLAAA